MQESRFNREQGDSNTTPGREKYWERNLSVEARKWFEEDNRYFLHQNLSTPVLNVLARAHGACIEDLDGKSYIDMHGNGVHNAGFNNPDIIAAVRKQLDSEMTFCPRRYTNIPAVSLAKKLSEAGISDYSIFLDEETLTLFGVQKLSDDNTAGELPGQQIMRRWWDYMADIMDVNPDNSPVEAELKEVFHLD